MKRLLPLLLTLACSGCYYTQLAGGQYELLRKRKPIAEVVQDQSRDARLRERLGRVLDARAFASSQLGLPDNGSYTQYTDLGRPYVMWNVFATPELSLDAITHCFPFAGCVSYRGYFKQASAEHEAEQMRADGDDTYVSGVPAYSTLGWFDDPVINSMMQWDDDTLLGTVFHELAHQKLYLKGDSAFNESFASFVEQEGLRQYLAARGLPSSEAPEKAQRRHEFTQLVLDARKRLAQVYASGAAPAQMRERKQQEFQRLTDDYHQLRDGAWNGYKGYDRWFDSGLNNAKLLPFGLYDRWVPAFARLYTESGANWSAFFGAAAQLAKLPEPDRRQRLDDLSGPHLQAE